MAVREDGKLSSLLTFNKGNKMNNENEIKADAIDMAMKEFPTENGMFDADGRLKAFIEECARRGLYVFAGSVRLLNDKEVEDTLKKFGLEG